MTQIIIMGPEVDIIRFKKCYNNEFLNIGIEIKSNIHETNY